MWTQFYDMHSGGSQKEKPYENIFIQLPEQAAIEYFEARFGHHPSNVTCNCCGNDYSIMEYESLEQATAFERNCDFEDGKWVERPTPNYNEFTPLEEFIKRSDVLIIEIP